jgi:hypothetical protein
MNHSGSILRGRAPREFLIFLGFLGLTIAMTWPWITHLRDAVTDPGDPYLNSWILWWDYHQTFHDPLNLFQSNIFYPYHYTLAFSEHSYGVALLFFPLFALGLRPLTINGIATLVGFAFCGYGMFRLARTLMGSKGAALIAAITFAFIPYRFFQMPHLIYLFEGWIPVLLEALVLFFRERSRRRAAWLGVAFFMNGLTCVHWFVLTLIPLALSAVLLLFFYDAWRDRKTWGLGLIAIGAAMLGLVPFLVPYVRAAQLYGFVRDPIETLSYSARPIDWLVGEERNKTWGGLYARIRAPERALFPGFMPPLLALAAIFVRKPWRNHERRWHASRIIAILLDVAAILSVILIIVVSGWRHLRFRVFGFYILVLDNATAVAIALALILLGRILVAYSDLIRRQWKKRIIESVQARRPSETFCLGVVWMVIGYFGSLGMRFPFHRFLFYWVPLFRSIRVPARWAMIAYVGLALLTGLGAKHLSESLTWYWPRIRPPMALAVLGLVLLFEQRSAPLKLIHGAVDPDALALKLKQTPMNGGIVELPSIAGRDDRYRYVLRAADHAKPIVTAVSGFVPPLQNQIQSLTEGDFIPDEFMDLLESIPCSYLVVHNESLELENRLALELFAAKEIAAGRLRFIGDYDKSYLYAVVKTEPHARSEVTTPESVLAAARPGPAKASLAHALLDSDRARLAVRPGLNAAQTTFVEGLIRQAEFTRLYSIQLSADQFVDALLKNLTSASGVTLEKRPTMVAGLNGGGSRASVVRELAEDQALAQAEYNRAFVLLHYFAYFKHDPDSAGLAFWLDALDRQTPNAGVDIVRTFINSKEYRARFAEQKTN